MVTGNVPFAGETPGHVVVSILEDQPSPLDQKRDVPEELEQIVAKALRKNREERYQSAAELARDLKALKRNLEVKLVLKAFF